MQLSCNNGSTRGPSINDVTHQGGGVKHFVTMCDEGGGGVENVTSHNLLKLTLTYTCKVFNNKQQ